MACTIVAVTSALAVAVAGSSAFTRCVASTITKRLANKNTVFLILFLFLIVDKMGYLR
jgi:ABC-type enterobactin transport system permease subunit